jgi:hypothetical protein
MEELEQELTRETSGHLYTRECCANAWYAIGTIHLRHDRFQLAQAAFAEALARVPAHAMARLGSAAILRKAEKTSPPLGETLETASPPRPIEAAICRAATCVLEGATTDAARIVDDALAGANPGSGGWLLPLEPLLRVTNAPDVWRTALSRVRARAA